MVVERVCDDCGTAFTAATERARFCGAACRVRSNRAAKKAAATASGTGSASASVQVSSASKPPAPVYDTLAEQVAASLSEAQALDTISGMAAVRVAQQIDRGRDGGSAVATLVNTLTRLVGEAKVEAAPRNRDGVTQVEDAVGAKLLRLSQAG